MTYQQFYSKLMQLPLDKSEALLYLNRLLHQAHFYQLKVKRLIKNEIQWVKIYY